MRAPDLVETAEAFSIGKARQRLALDATCELIALCDLLREASRKGSDEEMLVVRGISTRMSDLLDAVCSCIGDTGDPSDSIAERVGLALPALEDKA